MNARFRFVLALGAVAFGAMLGGCATTVSNPWWYYHYDPSSGSTTMSNPWWYYHLDPYGSYYRYYSYPWPDYYYRYNPHYPYWGYDARPMVSPPPPVVFDHRASASSREGETLASCPDTRPTLREANAATTNLNFDLFNRGTGTSGMSPGPALQRR